MVTDEGLCDKPECQQVLADVWLFLDDEMDLDRRAVVQHHLDDCSPCLTEAGLDQRLKEMLRTKCGGDRAPEQLRSRLIASLATVTVDASGITVAQTTVSVTQL